MAFVPLIGDDASETGGAPTPEPEGNAPDGAPVILHRSAALPLARARPSVAQAIPAAYEPFNDHEHAAAPARPRKP